MRRVSHCLELDLERAEGALLRLLGTIERRGWQVLSLTAAETAGRYVVQLTLEGLRDPQVLCRQLERLVDVVTVRVQTAGNGE
jgi:acetolactate synthase regulatory subunit